MNILDFLYQIVEIVEMYWQAFLALGGFAAFVPALINLLKYLKVVGEGDGDRWQAVVNSFLFLIFVGLRILLPDFDTTVVDSVLAQVASVIVAILSFLGQFGLSRLAYKQLWKGRAGVLGFYHS